MFIQAEHSEGYKEELEIAYDLLIDLLHNVSLTQFERKLYERDLINVRAALS